MPDAWWLETTLFATEGGRGRWGDAVGVWCHSDAGVLLRCAFGSLPFQGHGVIWTQLCLLTLHDQTQWRPPPACVGASPCPAGCRRGPLGGEGARVSVGMSPDGTPRRRRHRCRHRYSAPPLSWPAAVTGQWPRRLRRRRRRLPSLRPSPPPLRSPHRRQLVNLDGGVPPQPTRG